MFFNSISIWRCIVWTSRITFCDIWSTITIIQYKSRLILKSWRVAIRFSCFFQSNYDLFCGIPLKLSWRLLESQSIHYVCKFSSRMIRTHDESESNWYNCFRYVCDYVSQVAQMLVEIWHVFGYDLMSIELLHHNIWNCSCGTFQSHLQWQHNTN